MSNALLGGSLMISRMISSTCLVPFHGVLRLAYCNYILHPSPHTTGLDTRWIPHSLHHPTTWASVHIYKYRRNQERNERLERERRRIFFFLFVAHIPSSASTLLRLPQPKTSLVYTFTNTTHECLKRQYGTTDGLTDRFDIHYSDWATIMTYATLTPYESP